MLTTVIQACPDVGDRLGLGERPCRTGVVKFALGVVVVDQQGKAGRAGGLRPFQHLPVTPGVAGGQDRGSGTPSARCCSS